MSAFDDLLDEARQAGVQQEWIDRVRAASDGSPLRQEIKEWKTKYEGEAEKSARYEKATIGSVLAAHGFKGKPDALNIPADLDPLDPAKVAQWAADMGIIDPPAPTEDEQRRTDELAAHDRVDTASAGAGRTETPTDAARSEVLAARTPEEFDRIARQNGLIRT